MKIGQIVYTRDAEGALVMNDDFWSLPPMIRLDILQDIKADANRLYSNQHSEVFKTAIENISDAVFESLKGSAPDATGDLSSEEFVRKIRDEWP